MSTRNFIPSLIEKCDIYYDDFIVSSKSIVERYMSFFADQLEQEEKSTSFSFHTGSVCFDVVSVAAIALACFSYSMISNDEIIESLRPGDMVLYKGERHRWLGVEKIDLGNGTREYILLSQDAKGKNGPTTLYAPYETCKHLIKPYYGQSSVTDGRGIKKAKSNRNEFLSYIMGVAETEVPSTVDVSVVAIADKSEFIDICQHLKIFYGEGKSIPLTDIVPISYFTASGEECQIGRNPSKVEAVIKLTSKVSEARNLVLSKTGNKVVGLWSASITSLTDGASGLSDLIRRKSLKFAHVSLPYDATSCEMAIDQYEEAAVFACTKDILQEEAANSLGTEQHNPLLQELDQHINNIIQRKLEVIPVSGCWSWESFKDIKEALYVIRQSNWTGEDCDNFVLSSMALLNLFTSAFFTMDDMESAISDGLLNAAVVSPSKRLDELASLSHSALSMEKQCQKISDTLTEMYFQLYDASRKKDSLDDIIRNNAGKKIAIIVPKAYYADIFKLCFGIYGENNSIRCITANRFNSNDAYDLIIVCGDTVGKKFDALQCYAAPELKVLLYECEGKMFRYRQKKNAKVERKLRAKMQGLKGEAYKRAVDSGEDKATEDEEKETAREFASLDEFVEGLGLFDIRKLVSSGTSNSSYTGTATGTAEVDYVGTFVTGEQILFSKYYSAVVFDQLTQSISESAPEKLVSGDVLVFTKRDDYTRNIVDMIFSQLIESQKIDPTIAKAAQISTYWKDVLRKYKEDNRLTYRGLAKEMKKLGSSLQEVSIRQWLVPDSHIIRPRKEITMHRIAELTQDSALLADPKSFYDACSAVQHYRREILSLIATAIHDKLSNKVPKPGSVFEIVYEHVERLSETKELENVYQLDRAETVPVNLVNRPIVEAEVLL